MPVILVTGTEAGAGATTVAVGLAQRAAQAGRTVRLERAGADDRAAHDARVFANVPFASASGEPVEAASVAVAAGDAVTIIEAPADVAEQVATRLGARLIVVGPVEGETPAGATFITNHARRPGSLALPEDRALAAVTVGRLIEASRGRVLSRGRGGDRVLCEHLVIGPVASDSDDDYFNRYASKAVVTRAEKVDVALAALLTDTRCLILTGGGDPSPYLLDRIASSRDTTVIVAPEGTVETVRDIEGVFGTSPFSGESKVERIGELMRDAVDDAALAALIG